MAVVLHLVATDVWSALGTDEAITNPSLAAEGFIHCTDSPDVLLRIANAFYRAAPGDFCVLHVDTQRLESPCVWEAPAHLGPTEEEFVALFPHVYGAINRSAIVAVQPASRGGNGEFLHFGEVFPIA